ncbi:MAG TPA: hypothetical protein VK445_10540 [Dissulfurispiraceae bacterium]|nr:hypothetical protein [Dissulfurispiraceae bacterium]
MIFMRILTGIAAGICIAAVLGLGSETTAADKPIPTVYWMSVATTNQTFPGMPAGMPRSMMGRGGFGGGPKKTLLLQMNSPQAVPTSPEATHDIPTGMQMGPTLPLMIEEVQRHRAPEEQAEERFEKERMRILVYWGCGETVRQGQPRVIDTATMSPAEIGRAMRGLSLTAQVPPAPGRMRIYADWPNRQNSVEVPGGSSLVGSHSVHGNYTPTMDFAIDSAHDFLAPVEFTSLRGGLADSIAFNWRAIPNSLGYFSTAMASVRDNKEMIVWSSSESYMFGWQLMNYVASGDVRRLVKEKVVMPPDRTACQIPKGIFGKTEGAMLQFIAYGEDLHFGYPPKPKDPIWGVKIRSKSTGMAPLGREMTMEEGATDRSTMPTEQDRRSERMERPEPGKTEPQPTNPVGETINKIRGLLPF